jgi:NADH-quinone oxidoreductase subunit J
MAETIVFIVAALLVLSGALGVIFARNPVHSALLLVQTLFGVALLFIDLDAHFLAAVQVIVYAGAIVILFLFVIMLLGVDKAEDLEIEPIAGQRPVAVVVGAGTLALLLAVIISVGDALTGAPESLGPLDSLVRTTGLGSEPVPARSDIQVLGNWLFRDYVFAFEITGVLLTIAVVGAVTLARRPSGPLEPLPEDEALEVTP